ncbi:MAG TPA: alanine--tRNA ligase [Polyangiaceae bacterium]|jgi:alanyl-tRNA synthetase|nr:alanine--tRNA ligase [Polyangiaceae bacterium]
MSRTSQQIRQAFLDFFARREHEVVASGPLVPPNDPTLLFANAGMVQFKDVFTGRERRPYKRATSSQKCIRISGKHNDLENVGPSPRHHTFFEMLGNFSFGDYFKEEAIVFAWDFLTKELELPPDRLVCTYFKGEAGVPADETARDLWMKITGFGEDRVIGLGMADNFWQMGDTGPCGPSSEIHWFHGPDVDPSRFGQEQTPEGHGWMEIWNLVFMQFERDQSGHLEALPAPSIDTGAGLERLAGVIQGKLSNYDTDLLRALIDRASVISGKPYGGSMSPDDVSMRVIADHARTTAFLIAEGVLPDRTGREYVLRRVMRRAIRHGHRLGIERLFLNEVALEVVNLMGDQYPELRERHELISSVAEQEESRFRQTIERGLGLLDERFEHMEKDGQTTLSGADAFQLYDTYGFPLDLTQVISAERGYAVDVKGYEDALDVARQRSEFKGAEQAVESVYRETLDALGSNAGGGAQVRFTGYEQTDDISPIAVLLVDGVRGDSANEGAAVEVVTSRTPFYGESGGQVGDRGIIETETGVIDVEDTQKPVHGLVVHRGRVRSGTISAGQGARLRVDVALRDATRRNHSATHLLHLALRTVLGAHVQQKGSLVGPDRLRFDFTHGKALSADEIRRIEDHVNTRILGNAPVQTEVLSIDVARSRGAMMIFEEKYGDVVRMLTMADSVELCGGTHARATGDIGLFKIVAEQGVAAGVRRILATTGENSLAYLRELEERIGKAARAAKASPTDLADKIDKILLRERALEKQIEELERKLLSGDGSGGIDALLAKARDIGGVKVLGVRSEISDRGALRELAEQLRDKLGQAIVLVGSVVDDKAQLVLTVSKSLTDRYRAGDLIRGPAGIVGGSGGGRPDMAQAGGTEPSKLDEALEAIYARVDAHPTASAGA